ncbi:sugar O-acetyltransferase [Limosilactobacillus fermentum]
MSEEVKIDAKRVQAITNTGQAYDDVDPLVEAARNHAIKECRRYNFLVNSQNKYDYSILKGLFNKMGEENYIEPNFMCESGLNISLGSNVYINHDMVILDCNEVTIGDHISDSVLPGVTIGENSIIGAGSVVTKDIPANVIAAGNPCRVIRGIQKKG